MYQYLLLIFVFFLMYNANICWMCAQNYLCLGFVTWKEFHVHFLLAKGYKQNETLQHVEDYESLSIESEGQLSAVVVICVIICIFVLQDAPYCKLHFWIFYVASQSLAVTVAEKSLSGWIPLCFIIPLLHCLPLFFISVTFCEGSVFTPFCMLVCWQGNSKKSWVDIHEIWKIGRLWTLVESTKFGKWISAYPHWVHPLVDNTSDSWCFRLFSDATAFTCFVTLSKQHICHALTALQLLQCGMAEASPMLIAILLSNRYWICRYFCVNSFILQVAGCCSAQTS